MASKIRESIVQIHGLNKNDTNLWVSKWRNHVDNAKIKGCASHLTFDQYLHLASIAGLTDPNQIGVSSESYQLGRIGDCGDYTI